MLESLLLMFPLWGGFFSSAVVLWDSFSSKTCGIVSIMTDLWISWIIPMFLDRWIISQFSVLLLQTTHPASSINDDTFGLILREEVRLVLWFVLNPKRFIFDILVIVPQFLIFRLQILFHHNFAIDYVVPAGPHLLLLPETYVLEFASCIVLHLQIYAIKVISLLVAAILEWTPRNIPKIELLFNQISLALIVFIGVMGCIVLLVIIVPPQQRLILAALPVVLLIVTEQ